MTVLHVLRIGAAGPRVVFVHGSLHGGEAAWSEQFSLAENRQLLILDRRGYGQSPPSAVADPEVDASDILSVLENRPAHVVATSMGGVSAMMAAAMQPELVRSLTLIEPPLLEDFKELIEVRDLAEKLRVAYDSSAHSTESEFLTAFTKAIGVHIPLPEPLPSAMRQAAAMARTETPWSVHAPIDAVAIATYPKLVVAGTQVPAFERICEVLAERIGARCEKFSGAPHAVQKIGEPFNKVMNQFLHEQETDGRD